MYLFFSDSVCDILSCIQISRPWTLTKVAVVWCWYWCLPLNATCSSIQTMYIFFDREILLWIDWMSVARIGGSYPLEILEHFFFFFWLCFFYLLFFLWPLFMLAMGVILSLFLTRNWNWSRDSWALIEIKMLLRSMEFLLGFFLQV